MTVALFLDIDGVLNSVRYWYGNRPISLSTEGAIDPAAVAVLNSIVDRWQPYVVLSSSWRRMTIPTVQGLLEKQGFTGVLQSETPWFEDDKILRHRWEEIHEWLTVNPRAWDRYVVIDDDPNAWSNGGFADRGFYLSTNYGMGLVAEHVPLLANWLEGPTTIPPTRDEG